MAVGKNIKGITIQLDGDATPLQKALKDVDKASDKTVKELGQINRALKFDEGNTKLIAQKQEVLQEALQASTKRLDALKQAQKDVEAQFKAGKIDVSQFREFQREIEKTEGSIKSFKSQIDGLKAKVSVQADTSGIEKMKSELKELGPAAKEAAKEISSQLGKASAVGAAGMGAIAVGTNELNTDLARLKTNAFIAGRDMDIVNEAFKQTAAVSGEADSAVETLSNILASGFKDSQLIDVIDNINGAAIKFADTLKTEGIADGIQETVATGKAIGQFGELLERSGVNLEKFDEGMSKLHSNSARAEYVLATLNNKGFKGILQTYENLNPAIAENNQANVDLQIAMAQLGLAITPLIVAVTEIITKLTEWASENPKLAQTITVLMAIVSAIFAVFTALAPVISFITNKIIPLLMRFLPHLAKGFLALLGPIGAVIAVVLTVIWLAKLIIENWEPIKEFFAKLWDGIVVGFNFAVEKIAGVAKGLVNIIKAPINTMISLINGFLSGINKVKIPDWVPKVGGKGFNIPKIPMLAKGTDYFRGGYAIVGKCLPTLNWVKSVKPKLVSKSNTNKAIPR